MTGAAADRRPLVGRAFFDAPAVEVAPRLLGQVLEHRPPEGIVAVRLTEVEAYLGLADPASHAFRGPTSRNSVMFGPPGHVYVYFTYGMHYCINLVCGPGEVASAVLLRAGEVVQGIELATVRRNGAPVRDLARGPARLTVALGVRNGENGADACADTSPLRITAATAVSPDRVRTGPRVGVSSAAEVPWRFWADGEATVSVYRPHVPRRRAT